MNVIKEIYSINKLFKAEIQKRDDGLFHIDVFKWDEEWSCWLQVSPGFSLTDNEKSAEEIALEKLNNCCGEE